jgi:hypothetical protein
MAGTWREIVQLRFKGERFRDHALDLTALTELRQFQKIVAETAKVLWRAANPDRERLPAHFEDRTRLCLRRIESGSAVAPLEVWVEDEGQAQFWDDEPKEIKEAVALARDVFDHLDRDLPLPDRFPKELISEYAEWGKTLDLNEEVEFEPVEAERRAARVNRRNRERLTRFLEAPYSSTVEIMGHVLEADVRQRRFQVWVDEQTAVVATFNQDQEGLVTSALKDHRSLRILVRGTADVSPQGRPTRFTVIEELRLLSEPPDEIDPAVPAIEDVLADLASRVPDGEWKRLPADLTDNLDHYLYGTPKS